MTDSTGDMLEKANQKSKATLLLPCFFAVYDFVMKEYKTVEKEGFDEFVEKKSRFIGYIKPVTTQKQAAEFINSIKSKHWDAAHNVYAYVLRENNIQRSSDDGEPSSTAGIPVLEVLLKEELVDICVVVTRYFGGTLLGTGGLVRAYSHAAKIAVNAGNIITMAPCIVCTVCVDYSFYDRLNSLFDAFNANIENIVFSEVVTVTFTVKADLLDLFSSILTQQSNGKYGVNQTGKKYSKV